MASSLKNVPNASIESRSRETVTCGLPMAAMARAVAASTPTDMPVSTPRRSRGTTRSAMSTTIEPIVSTISRAAPRTSISKSRFTIGGRVKCQASPPAGTFAGAALDGGGSHTCGIRHDGTLSCWGANGSGQLGDGTTTQRTTPVRVKAQNGTDDLTGIIAIADPVKATTPETLKALTADGVRVVMLTGDNRTTAQAVARRLDIAEVEAEVLPEQKSAVVERLRREGRVVAMAGDGVNDAPALAQAQVGIAMGTGTDVAMESAAVTLVKGDLRGIVRARRLSRATMRNIRQNLFFAFVFNALAVPIAAGAFYPVFGLLLNPMIASAAMSLSSVTVVGNALRLRARPL